MAAVALVASEAPKRRLITITPKNGKYPVILLAGGPADRARELRDMFAKRRGAMVKYHWDYEKIREWQRPIPADVDLVVALKTMMGHRNEGLLRGAAAMADVPIVMTAHKWSVMDNALRQRVSLPKAPPLPLEVRSTAILMELHELPEPEAEDRPPLRAEPPPPAPEAKPAPLPAAEATEYAMRDTIGLIREVQLRLARWGVHTIMLSPESVEMAMGPARLVPM